MFELSSRNYSKKKKNRLKTRFTLEITPIFKGIANLNLSTRNQKFLIKMRNED